MGERAHTPGPWAITGVSMSTGNVSVGHKNQRIVIAEVTNAASFGDMLAGAMRRGGGGFSQADCTTQFANASLIAAAPDMFEALKAADEALAQFTAFELDAREIMGNTNFEIVKLRREQIKAALAKAAPSRSSSVEG